MSEIIQQHQEIKQNRVVIDPRSFWRILWDALQKPWIPFAWAIVATLLILLWPGFGLFALAIQLVLWLAVTSKPDVLPIHLPMEANKPDLNDPKPGDNNGYYKARGSFFIGRLRGTGIEVWVSFKALTQHFLIFGTTGAGKTESIVSYIVNYLAVGSGVAFQDAKAAPKAMIQMATLCRIFGRDDDFRVTNYITGMTSAKRDPAERLSNDAAVFARGSAESNTQLLVSLMPPSEGENKIFSERAIALVAAEMPALTELRDLGKMQIDPSIIRKYMSFREFAELYRNNNISKRSRDALKAYLESLPGFDETKAITEQPEEVTRQFGFAQAYFTRALASLSDTYGHIYLVGQGEIDYQDAVLNGRILMTLLPSMEKSGDELANLGKIVLTATRNGMVVGLGTVFEGNAEDIVHNLPTNSDIPYGVMNDENAYMLVEGQEMINAQARGLGFGVMTGTQDAPGMLLGLEKTTKQIMANSAFKQVMYLDDKDTTELAVEFSGEANVMVRGRYEMDGELGNYYAAKDVSIERRHRLSATAIKKQGLGQAYLMYQGKIHEVQVFNHGIAEKSSDPTRSYLSHWYSVRMAKVRIPSEKVLQHLYKLSPRPEWQDLMLMINDNSRAMLKEMCIYFSSMLAINKIARSYIANPGMTSLIHEAFGSRKLLEDNYDPPVGLLQTICDNAPNRIEETSSLLALLIRTHESEQSAVLRMADEAGLDAVMHGAGLTPTSTPLFAEDDEDDSHSEGSSSGHSSPGSELGGLSGEDTADLLSDYLSANTDAIAATTPGKTDLPYSSQTLDAEDDDLSAEPQSLAQPSPAPAAPEKRSAFANAVERNLANMPWMASAIEYRQVESALVQTEEFFTDDIEKAQESVSVGLDTISEQLKYPETPIPDTLLRKSSPLELMHPFLIDTGQK